ncbi:MAG: hypothetical protein EP329_28585 [Deltaproteobacteria bacterium]|nr:MAG: hypothetical protein EP329_28585 [Deltaproteobacteria bacterium]
MASRWLGVVVAAGLFVACDDSTGTTNAGVDTLVDQDTIAQDTTAEEDTVAVALETVRFRVIDPELRGAPVAGALVTFTPPCESALKAVSDADGAISFETALDWSCGSARVRVTEAEHATLVVDGLAESDLLAAGSSGMALPMTYYDLTEYTAESEIVVEGGVEWFQDLSHTLLVDTDTSPSRFQGPSDHWSVGAARGEPFNWIALEFHQGSAPPFRGYDQIIDQAAAGVVRRAEMDRTMAINFATTSVPIERTQIAFPAVPTPSAGLSAGVPYVVIADRSGLTLGYSERLGATALNSEASGGVAWLALESVTEPRTVLLWSASGVESVVLVDGLPSAGTQDVTFLRPPELTSPDKAKANVALTWTNPEPERHVVIAVLATQGAAEGRAVARVLLPPATTTATLTELGFPEEALAGQRLVTVATCDLDQAEGSCRRIATSSPRSIFPAN